MSKQKRTTSAGDRRRDRYVSLKYSVLESPAYRALSCGARCLLIELLRLWNGSNNGKLFLSIREAAKLVGCANDTAAKLFDELMAKGFIKLNERGWFSSQGGLASTWIITDCPILAQPHAIPPTREYLQWNGTDFELPKRTARSGSISKKPVLVNGTAKQKAVLATRTSCTSH
jgi:hypothetical protein